MITTRATADDGTEILALGITRGNVEALLRGHPISLNAATHPGFPDKLRVLIYFGETERAIMDQLKTLIGADTKIIAVPRAPGRVS